MIPVIITACGDYNIWNFKGDDNFDLFENQCEYDFYYESDKPTIILSNCRSFSIINNIFNINIIIANLFIETFEKNKWYYTDVDSDCVSMNKIIFDKYKKHLTCEYFINDKFVKYNIDNCYKCFESMFLDKFTSIEDSKFDVIIEQILEKFEFILNKDQIAIASKFGLSDREIIFEL